MAGTLIQIADGLETRLATITGLRVFDHIPDVFAVPCAFVAPQTVSYWNSFGGGDVQMTYIVTVVVGRASERSSQKSLYGYMAYSGGTSVREAIEDDRSLGGVAQTCIVQNADNIRMVSSGDADYLAVDFQVLVHA